MRGNRRESREESALIFKLFVENHDRVSEKEQKHLRKFARAQCGVGVRGILAGRVDQMCQPEST